MKSVAFRVDASVRSGTGHVMRCLALAGEMQGQGIDVRFVCRDQHGHLAERVEAAGHRVHLLPPRPLTTGDTALPGVPVHSQWLLAGWEADAADTVAALADVRLDWLIVDHYGIDTHWEERTRGLATRLMAIDDLADRAHACDLLLDQNLGRSESDYDGLVPPHCRRLVGPEHALLRPEFARLRATSLARRGGRLTRILISLGGVDADNATGWVLENLRDAGVPAETEVLVVMGAHAPHLAAVRAQAATMTFPCTVSVDVPDMAGLLAGADLAIGAGGGSAWERCALGVPSIVLVLADNQRGVAEALSAHSAAIVIPSDSASPAAFREALRSLARPGARLAVATSAAGLVDGLGTRRVLQAMEDAA